LDEEQENEQRFCGLLDVTLSCFGFVDSSADKWRFNIFQNQTNIKFGSRARVGATEAVTRTLVSPAVFKADISDNISCS